MILAHLQQDLELPERVAAAIEHLRRTNYIDHASGRYDINEWMFVLVQDPLTQSWDMGMPEFHRKHIDVQYLLRGEELIGYLPASPEIPVVQDFLESRDIAFVAPQENETRLILSSGMYAVFFPGELHRPCRSPRHDQHIKKVVIKIKAD